MPTELEEELLEMAAAERRRTQQPQHEEATSGLPPLEPETLLSAAACQEMAAARQSRDERGRSYLFESSSHGISRELVEEMLGSTVPVQPAEQVPVELTATIELSGPDADWVREELARGHNPSVSMGAQVATAEPNANGDIFNTEDLASIFMTREARSQAELAGVSGLVAESDGIEFSDPGMNIESMSRSHHFGGPHSPGGQIVSQRGENGRWTPVATQAPRPMAPAVSPRTPIGARRTFPAPTAPERSPSPPAAPQRPVDRSSIPTALDRLMGQGPLDD